jgi:hypothetical protein
VESFEGWIIMAYPSPASINATAGLNEFLPYLTVVTDWWFGRMIMIAIFSIFFFGYLSTRKDDYIGAMAVSSYVTFVIGLLFWVINLLSGLDFGVIIGCVCIGSVLLLTQKKDY